MCVSDAARSHDDGFGLRSFSKHCEACHLVVSGFRGDVNRAAEGHHD
jgi:hypothetical protein